MRQAERNLAWGSIPIRVRAQVAAATRDLAERLTEAAAERDRAIEVANAARRDARSSEEAQTSLEDALAKHSDKHGAAARNKADRDALEARLREAVQANAALRRERAPVPAPAAARAGTVGSVRTRSVNAPALRRAV